MEIDAFKKTLGISCEYGQLDGVPHPEFHNQPTI